MMDVAAGVRVLMNAPLLEPSFLRTYTNVFGVRVRNDWWWIITNLGFGNFLVVAEPKCRLSILCEVLNAVQWLEEWV